MEKDLYLNNDILSKVKDRIVTVRGINVILDSDVAEIYGVETKRINEAVKNNYDKFPENYPQKADILHEFLQKRAYICLLRY